MSTENLMTVVIICLCIGISIVSLITSIKKNKKLIIKILAFIGFLLSLYVPFIYGIYTYGSNFIESVGSSNFSYLITKIEVNDFYAFYIFCCMLITIILSFTNFVCIFKNNR